MLTLREALAVGGREVVAFVGAGGKTTAMFRLADELRADGRTVVVTTTTKIMVPAESEGCELVVGTRDGDVVAATANVLGRGHVPVVGRAITPDGKLAGVTADQVADLAALPRVTHVLVEADGAAHQPFKAPREDEPVITASATLVVPVVGIEALGRPLLEVSQRPERVMALTGLGPADRLDARAIARVLIGPGGCTNGAPSAARIVPLVNKADDAPRLEMARELAAELRRSGADRVVIATLGGSRAVVEVLASAPPRSGAVPG